MTAGRTSSRDRAVPRLDGITSLALLGGCFLLGTLAGFAFSCLGGGSEPLREYLLRYLRQAGEGAAFAPSLFSVIWEVFRWFLLVFLLGFTALGAVGIPAVLAARAFVLSYAAATFARLFGLSGMAASFAALPEVLAAFAVPCAAPAPCAAVWPAALAALTYCCLICRFCQNREMGLLAACASWGLSCRAF